MLRTDVIDLINSGEAWAFVGSGASLDAGAPTWKQLVEGALGRVGESEGKALEGDATFAGALAHGDYPRCLGLIEQRVGRDALEQGVREQLDATRRPGSTLLRLANWPFAGYITTNHENLLKLALDRTGDLGWSVVGNSRDEVRKVSGGASRLVWHIHGNILLGPNKSRLIITEDDYDDIYAEGSPVIEQLRALLSQRRVVFVGFGFRDAELMRVLKTVGRLSHPARPLYAFIPNRPIHGADTERRLLLSKFNVDSIPYQLVGDSHKQLDDLLDVYGSLILARSLRFEGRAKACPSYDPEATGVLIYNQLALKGPPLPSDVLDALLRSSILSLLMHSGPSTHAGLTAQLEDRAKLLRPRPGGSSPVASGTVERILRQLQDAGLVTIQKDRDAVAVSQLTRAGENVVSDQAATARRLADQFSDSLKSRAGREIEDASVAGRIAQAAESFLKDCVERRALGVAMATNPISSDQHSYHMVALLQTLPMFMSELASPKEGKALSHVIEGVLSAPSPAESSYIGLALQARFGVHLLGYDPDALAARIRDFADTLFLVDSSTLIPLVAPGSVGHEAAQSLLSRLQKMGSIVRTTSLLAEEVAEHARWALGKVDREGRINSETIMAATGRAGEGTNAFLEGFLAQLDAGGTAAEFVQYLNAVLGTPMGKAGCSTDDVVRRLSKEGIASCDFHTWRGFTEELWRTRDELMISIANRRETAGTYRHERQVRAEAEAVLIIKGIREGSLGIDGVTFSNAYFLSNTRLLDDLLGPGAPITMRPRGALQWLATLDPLPIEELGVLTNSLLWELAERGLSIVNKSVLQRVFSPFISASKERLSEEIQHHRVLIAQRYGENGVKAFEDADSFDLPIAADSFYAQLADDLSQRLVEERSLRERELAVVKTAERSMGELALLRAREKIRHEKALTKVRSAAKKDGKRRRRGK